MSSNLSFGFRVKSGNKRGHHCAEIFQTDNFGPISRFRYSALFTDNLQLGHLGRGLKRVMSDALMFVSNLGNHGCFFKKRYYKRQQIESKYAKSVIF